jgi:type III secretory pathway lipoprotein EscJ
MVREIRMGRGYGTRVLFLCCVLAPALLASGCGDKPLALVGSESEAIEIVTLLQQNGVSAEKQEAGEASARQWNIVVNGSDYAFAGQLLRYYELPRPVEKAGQQGLLTYEMERRAEQLRTKKREIEEHVRKLNGVARVSVVISPPQDESQLNPYPAKANVIVTHVRQEPPVSREEIQQTVASSFPTLSPENVTVKLQYDPPPAPPRRDAWPALGNALRFAPAVVAALLPIGALIYFLRKRRRRQSPPPLTPAGEVGEGGEVERAMLSSQARSDAG